MSDNAAILKANLDKLGEKDKHFAESLLSQLGKKGKLSEKQAHWIGVLTDRATKPKPEAKPLLELGNIGAIVEMITNAKSKLKWPKLLIDSEAGTLRISLAGANAKFPGSVNVTDNVKDTEGRFGWVGRILTDGQFQPGMKIDNRKLGLAYESLMAFAADPAGVAKAYGVKTGHCCFCSRELTDKVSVGLGYGPVCAAHWGLPHTLTCE